MNLTIHLTEQRLDNKSGKISGGHSTFKDIRSLKVEYTSYGTNKYKTEIVLFIGDKFNKQLITIDCVEKEIARHIASLIHQMAYNNGVITAPEKEDQVSLGTKLESPDSYMSPEYFNMSFMNTKYRNIVHRTMYIYNGIKDVDIEIVYENNPSKDNEKSVLKSGKFKFGKLNQPEENNPGSDYGEVWEELSEDRYRAFMAILNGVNKWKGDIEAIKHNTNISCGKIWKVKPNKDDQLVYAVVDAEPDGDRYIMRLYGGLNGHGDWESYLDGLRTYIKCIKRMPGVDSVDLLETQSDLPDDTFSVLIVVRYESGSERIKKKKKDPNEEIDYRELV